MYHGLIAAAGLNVPILSILSMSFRPHADSPRDLT
jgi:hypothetical protein